MSIDYSKGPSFHYALAKELMQLRKKGVLIIGSGNMVHNLGMVAWDKLNEPSYGYDWALEMNNTFKELILNGYLKEETIRLGHISADPNMKPHKEDIFLALQGISLFRQYMQNMIRMGDIAAAELFDHEQALDEVRAEEAYVV